jgi:hypothetical protein
MARAREMIPNARRALMYTLTDLASTTQKRRLTLLLVLAGLTGSSREFDFFAAAGHGIAERNS